MKDFSEDGLSFSYPDDWQLTHEDAPEGWTATLQSPGTAFAVVRMDRGMPTTEEVAVQALEALREDYPQLDAQPSIEMIGGEMAVGHDVEFFSLDLATTCSTRSGNECRACTLTSDSVKKASPGTGLPYKLEKKRSRPWVVLPALVTTTSSPASR